jgi:NADP-dependent 3-hydroxy acid dehydrogenase YdfG
MKLQIADMRVPATGRSLAIAQASAATLAAEGASIIAIARDQKKIEAEKKRQP